MLFFRSFTFSLPLYFISSSVAYPQASSTTSTLPQATDLYHFPNGVWVENLALRSNDGILATFAVKPEVAYLDPSQPGAQPQTIATFPTPATSTLGITELSPDIFYVATEALNASAPTTDPIKGRGQVWRVDMRQYDERAEAPVELVANLTESLFLNGLTHIPGSNLLLVADYSAQVVWSLDVETRQVAVAVNDTLTASPATNTGVNGVHYQNEYLYFTNTDRKLYARTPIDATTGAATGPSETLTEGLVHPDDFALTGSGNDAYMADGTANSVKFTAGDGASSPVCGVLGPTAVQLGRGKEGRKTLYISSGGNETEFVVDPAGTSGGKLSKFVLT